MARIGQNWSELDAWGTSLAQLERERDQERERRAAAARAQYALDHPGRKQYNGGKYRPRKKAKVTVNHLTAATDGRKLLPVGRDPTTGEIVTASGMEVEEADDPILLDDPAPALNDALAAATAKVSEEKARRAVANEGESKCVVCLEAARDVVFMPCFHVVSCWNCGLRVSECPVCRVAIEQKRRVYS